MSERDVVDGGKMVFARTDPAYAGGIGSYRIYQMTFVSLYCETSLSQMSMLIPFICAAAREPGTKKTPRLESMRLSCFFRA